MNDKSRLWFALFVLVVFCAGLGTGVLLTRFSRPPFGGFRGGRHAGLRRPPDRHMLSDRLATELQLTPDQKSRVETIFTERRKRLEQFHQDVRARFEAEQRDLHAEIEKVLTPEQRERFQTWLHARPFGFGGPGRRPFGGPGPPPPR